MNTRHRDSCDGVDRRGFLQVGMLGMVGLGLSDYLSVSHALGTPAGKPIDDKHAIFINLGGGASHHDTFDPKPSAPSEIRGEFGVTRTNTGEFICELLPQLAACADKYTLIRSVTHNLGAHAPAGQFIATGNRPLPSLLYPSYGSVVVKEKPAPSDVPPYVAIPDGGNPGYLGVSYSSYAVGGDPNAKDFGVRSLSLPKGFTLDRLNRRRALTKSLETMFAEAEAKPELIEGLDQFQKQAYAIISSSKTREAFDIHQEPDAVRECYGRNTFGQSLLLARRLIEGQVRFVTVGYPGSWDTHEQNFQRLKQTHLPWLDQGLPALLLDLDGRGLLERTLIFMTGEFGRTPKVNAKAGRDHWPYVFTMFLAGGGVTPGQMIGKSDSDGGQPADRSVSPEDVAATFYHLLGVDHRREYRTPTGRPIQIVRDGNVIRELA